MLERCIDASIAIKWFIKGESFRQKALKFLRDSQAAGITLIAPPLFEMETDSVTTTRRDKIKNSENNKMSTNHNLENLVATLVQEHFDLESDLEQIIWLNKGPASEIRLLEVNRNTAATGMVEVFGFAPSADVPYPLRIAEITPDEWERVQNGNIPLPESWSLEEAEIFTREHVFA